MCRELAPEKDALFVEQLLVEQVVRLVGLTEGIEACIANLLDTRTDLLRTEAYPERASVPKVESVRLETLADCGTNIR